MRVDIFLRLSKSHAVKKSAKLRNGPAPAIRADARGLATPSMLTYAGTKNKNGECKILRSIPRMSQKYAALNVAERPKASATNLCASS